MHTNAHTYTQSCPGLTSFISPAWSIRASAVLVDHTSTHQPFIVPSTVVMETVNVARRRRRWWPRGSARPLHGWHFFTHTHIHACTLLHTTCVDLTLTHIYTYSPLRGSWTSRTVLKTHNAPASLQIVGNPGHVEHI